MKPTNEMNKLLSNCGLKSKPFEIDPEEKRIAIYAQRVLCKAIQIPLKNELFEAGIFVYTENMLTVAKEEIHIFFDIELKHVFDVRWDMVSRAIELLSKKCIETLKKRQCACLSFEVTPDPKAYNDNKMRLVAHLVLENPKDG